MKFEQRLEFNAVEAWRGNYLNYEQLKRHIYRIEQAKVESKRQPRPSMDQNMLRRLSLSLPIRQMSSGAADAVESGATIPLLEERAHSTEIPFDHREAVQEGEFARQIEMEFSRVYSFLLSKKAELMEQWTAMKLAEEVVESSYQRFRPSGASSGGPACWKRVECEAQRRTLAALLPRLYVEVHDLADFADLNETGFRKILKKHDKVTDTEFSGQFMPGIAEKLKPEKTYLEGELSKILKLYANVEFDGSEEMAKRKLHQNLQDQVTFERQAVWKDRMEQEARLGNAAAVERSPKDENKWSVQRFAQPAWILLACAIAAAIMLSDLFSKGPSAQTKRSCLAILISAAVLWCTEALPLFATSMLVPFLVVVFRALNNPDGTPMTAQQAMSRVFAVIFSQTVMLLLGGFTMASALSKHLIAKRMAIAVLQQVGLKAPAILLAAMMIAVFSSMWISNVAAPVLCYSIVQPILRTLSTEDDLSKALVMGIALASNIGGMSSPIASPQNIFAMERMSISGTPPSWLTWFAVSWPVALFCILFLWRFLLMVYPMMADEEVRPLRQLDDPVTWLHVYVIGVCLVTMGLWCGNAWVLEYVGGMGITALVPMVCFFGFGVLKKDDFESFPWSVVMLAMGGVVLGESTNSSGLLTTLGSWLASMVSDLSLWEVLAVFCLVISIVTSFISHTVGAMVMLPIVQSVGQQLTKASGIDHSKLLVVGCALMCSGGMALPVSGFPNMSASSMQDSVGRRYVSVRDFLMVGVPGTAFVWIAVISVGFVAMQLLGL